VLRLRRSQSLRGFNNDSDFWSRIDDFASWQQHVAAVDTTALLQ